jgi:hypothetical protein
MPRSKYRVSLREEERAGLHKLVTSGRARTLTRARILLKPDGGDDDQTIAEALEARLKLRS